MGWIFCAVEVEAKAAFIGSSFGHVEGGKELDLAVLGMELVSPRPTDAVNAAAAIDADFSANFLAAVAVAVSLGTALRMTQCPAIP